MYNKKEGGNRLPLLLFAFYYDSIKGELTSEGGAVMNAGNLNLLYRSYFTDNVNGWTVDPTAVDSVASFLEQVNTLVKDTKKNTNIKVLGYGYKQSLNMYEGGHFIVLQFGYKNGGKGKEQVIKLIWTVDITVDENGIIVANPTPYDDNTNRWITNLPIVTNVMEALLGTFTATPAEGHLFNATSGMILSGDKNLPVMGSSKVSM